MSSQPKTENHRASSAVQKKKSKKKQHQTKELVPGQSIKNMIATFKKSLGVQGSSLSALKSQQNLLFRKAIPFLRDQINKKTQTPTIRIPFTVNVITISSNAISIARGLYNQNLQDWTDFTDVFSEFRYLGGQVEYIPCEQPSSAVSECQPACGVISYRETDSGAPSNIGEMVAYDTKKWFVPVLQDGYGDGKLHITKWPIQLDWVPDMEWLPIDNNSVVPAYFKLYGSVTGTNTTAIGYFTGYMDVQFRGIQA